MALNMDEGRNKYLAVLDLPHDANNDDIKTTYKKLALQHHPDKNPSDPTATIRFYKLSQAYYQLTRKYSDQKFKSLGQCPDCGCCYCYDSEDEDEDFTDEELEENDEDSYASWFFKKLFVDVFGEYIFKKRFQARKKPKSQKFTQEEVEEDVFFDFIYKKYRDDGDEDITEEDLRKFHTYDDWLKDRDPKKRPNHRTRRAKKKFNCKIQADKPKKTSKKQQLAEQYRREKEMKEISEQLRNKINIIVTPEKQISNQRKVEERPALKNSGTSDVEILKEVEIQLKENRKNELQKSHEQSSDSTEISSNRKKRRKALKEMKKQIKEEATKNLKKEPEKVAENIVPANNSTKNVIDSLKTHDIDMNIMGNPAGERQTREKEIKSSILQSALCGIAPPAHQEQTDKKAELLQRHLKQYNELMKVQPIRHTEKQMTEERIKEKNKQLQKQQEELIELRHANQGKEEHFVSTRLSQSRDVDEEFERMRKEHLRKQQEMERKRNEEEIKEMHLNRSKHVKATQPQSGLKWYEKSAQSGAVSLPPPPSRNVWAERFRQQEVNKVPMPSTVEEEEEMLRKVLEMSQITAQQDEERRKYRQQMASKEFIPEQLKQQMEENKNQILSTCKPVDMSDKLNKKWSTIVTSNLSSQDIEQEVKYTDLPERKLKILETNYDNLKPNVKIKIPCKNDSDEDWDGEIQNLDISPKIPTTIDKYIEWNKNVKQLPKDDNETTKQLVKKNMEIPDFANRSGDCPENLHGRKIDTKITDMSHDVEINKEDWDLATDENWGAKVQISNNGDTTKYQSVHSQRLKDMTPRSYKQKPMKSISKLNNSEHSNTARTDYNHNIQEKYTENVDSGITLKTHQIPLSNFFASMEIPSETGNWNKNKDSKSFSASNKQVPTLSDGLQKQNEVQNKDQPKKESWDDELIEVPTQTVVKGEHSMTGNQFSRSPIQPVVKGERSMTRCRFSQSPWQDQGSTTNNVTKLEKINRKFELESKPSSDCISNTQNVSSSENWEDELIPDVSNYDQKVVLKTCTLELSNNGFIEETKIHPTRSPESKSVSAKDQHRLPALKNLSSSSEEDVELPSCRLPRLSHLSTNNKLQNFFVGMDVKENQINESEKTEMQNSTNLSSTSVPVDLNIPSATLNMPYGLPPHLFQAYIQYLSSSGNTSAMGLLPSLANMPLLPGLIPLAMPNPLISASPVLAYSLQQQQLAAMNMAMATCGLPGGNMMGANGIFDMGICTGLNTMTNISGTVDQKNSALVGNKTSGSAQSVQTSANNVNKASLLPATDLKNENLQQKQTNPWSDTDSATHNGFYSKSVSKDEKVVPHKTEVIHTSLSQNTAVSSKNPNMPPYAESTCQKTVVPPTDLPSYSKLPYDFERKKEQMQTVEALINGLTKQPSSLLENSDLDPRYF